MSSEGLSLDTEKLPGLSEPSTIKIGLWMCLGQLKFFIALHMTLNDHESTVSIDLGGYKEILASRQICKYKIMNNDINVIK